MTGKGIWAPCVLWKPWLVGMKFELTLNAMFSILRSFAFYIDVFTVCELFSLFDCFNY